VTEVKEAGRRRRKPRYYAAHDSAKSSRHRDRSVIGGLVWATRPRVRPVEETRASGRPTAAISPAPGILRWIRSTRQLQLARGRVAIQDRLPRSAPGVSTSSRRR
jgi:hypothetical protein